MAAAGEKANPFEILGVWLGVWTAPHDVVIPPPPSRRTLGLLGLGLLVVAGLIVAFVLPALGDVRERNAARDARLKSERDAAYRARIEREQRPRSGSADGPSRAIVMAQVEAAIGEDARRRFDPDARPATCEPVAGADVAARRVAFDCHSSVREIVGAGPQEGARGNLSIPFRAIVDFGSGRYAFCKVNPPPGEKALPDPRTTVELPAACRPRA